MILWARGKCLDQGVWEKFVSPGVNAALVPEQETLELSPPASLKLPPPPQPIIQPIVVLPNPYPSQDRGQGNGYPVSLYPGQGQGPLPLPHQGHLPLPAADGSPYGASMTAASANPIALPPPWIWLQSCKFLHLC